MNFAFKITLLIMAAPLLCGAALVVGYVVLIALSIPQLPAWAQGGATAWLLGTPQPAGSETSDNGSLPAGVGVGWEGYVDLEDPGPPRGLPLAGTVYLGCLFHDPAYSDHTGVDFPANEGSPVYSTMTGLVV